MGHPLQEECPGGGPRSIPCYQYSWRAQGSKKGQRAFNPMSRPCLTSTPSHPVPLRFPPHPFSQPFPGCSSPGVGRQAAKVCSSQPTWRPLYTPGGAELISRKGPLYRVLQQDTWAAEACGHTSQLTDERNQRLRANKAPYSRLYNTTERAALLPDPSWDLLSGE